MYRDVLVDVLGDRFALYGVAIAKGGYQYWSLHVWDWHQGRRADAGHANGFIEIRFLQGEALSSHRTQWVHIIVAASGSQTRGYYLKWEDLVLYGLSRVRGSSRTYDFLLAQGKVRGVPASDNLPPVVSDRIVDTFDVMLDEETVVMFLDDEISL
ncbi:hypothetical protein F4604DRAFT_1689629 [Suillus subluteus]|nr:hypothetical protein F4604DRAFT_1689629 [Suillus subluteus]